jgi:hypothetical protein
MNSYQHNNSNKSVNTSTEQKSQTISKASLETPYSQLPDTHAKILQLQKTIGNRAVMQLINKHLQPRKELENEASKDASSCSQLKKTNSVIQLKGWKPEELIDYMKTKGLKGVCNSLSAAWLTNMIAPDKDDVGVNDETIKKIEMFKTLLDAVVGFFYGEYDSRYITIAFIDYFREKLKSNWLNELTESNVDEEFDAFKEYVKDDEDGWQPDRDDFEEAETEGKYEELTKEKLYKMIDGALEPFFSMNDPFYGVVVLGADMRSDTKKYDYESYKGHQMAVRYTPDSKYLFEIYDQNAGLIKENICDQEEIAEILTEHLHKGYIDNPIEGTNYAKISVSFNKKG